MHLTWLIEAGVYGTDADPPAGDDCPARAAFVAGHGRAVAINGAPLNDDDCVLAYGTFPFARQIQLHHLWRPGA